MDKKMPCCSVQQGPFEFPVYSGNFRYCCRNVTVPNRRHGNFRASSSRTDHAISWFVPDGSQGDHGMNHCFRPLACLLTLVMFAGPSGEATAARHKQTSHAKKGHEAKSERHHRHATSKKRGHEAKGKPASDDKSAERADTPALTDDLAMVKEAITLARKGKTTDATDTQKKLDDPAAQKLVEWYILRHPDADAKFSRFAAFIADSPDWPGMALMRRRAEARLWQEHIDATTVRTFTGDKPTSAKGRLALARALLAEGDRDGATR